MMVVRVGLITVKWMFKEGLMTSDEKKSYFWGSKNKINIKLQNFK